MADLLSELARDIDRACRLTGTFTLRSGQVATESVSYTHLTLPTIYSV